jgi:uncharacterized protein YggE
MDSDNNKNMHHVWGGGRMRGLISTLLIVLIVFVAVKAMGDIKGLRFVGSNSIPSATIEVTGTGERVVKPDIADFSFTIEKEAGTVQAAQTAVDAIAAKALDFLKNKGVDEKDIQTTNYAIYPRYEYHASATSICTQFSCPPGDVRVLAGYDVSESFSVKVRNIADSGALLGGIGDLGITNVGGISFSVDKKDDLMAEARADAIAEARKNADALAKELGVTLVRVVSFRDAGGSVPMPMYALDAAGSTKSVAQIATGETTISSSVVVTYEIN